MLKSLLCFALAGIIGPISWGLSPNTREEVPVAPDGVATMLKQYNGFYVSDTTEKKVFLTFDLGYEAGYTAEVLDILKQHDIKGIFFLCGHYLTERDLVTRMISEGHTIGNHTDKHKDLPTLSVEGMTRDIMTFQTDFADQYPDATPPVYFRPPKGRLDERMLRVAHENNLKTAMWSIAIVDWGKKPIEAQKNADKIASRVHPGAVVLLHIANSGMPAMLKLLIPQIFEKGYTFGTPTEIII